jgi:hypothetical protein
MRVKQLKLAELEDMQVERAVAPLTELNEDIPGNYYFTEFGSTFPELPGLNSKKLIEQIQCDIKMKSSFKNRGDFRRK